MSDAALMQDFFDSADAFFYIKDAGGRFLLVNKTGARALGLSETDCVGKTAFDLVPKEEAERTTQMDRRVADTGKPINFKDVVHLRSGPRTLLDHKFAISIPGHPGATAGIVIDVTDIG